MSLSSPNRESADQSRRFLWLLVCVEGLLFAGSFYRGFRAPNLWSLNYYQVSWPDGFVRRGLLGTLLYPLGCARFDPHTVWSIQFAVLAATVALFFRLGRRGAAAFFLCLFLLSDAGPFLFHEVGYPDQLLMLLTVAACASLEREKPWAAALILALAALIHEMAVFTALPVLLVQWLRLPPRKRPSPWKLLAPLALVMALVSFNAPVPLERLQRYVDLASACGHPLHRRDFLVYYTEAFKDEFHFYYQLPELLGALVPLALSLGLWIVGGEALPRAGRLERWAVLGACLCPLLLGTVGTDKNRWIFLMLTQALILVGTDPSAETGLRARSAGTKRITFALPLVLTLMLLHIKFFDKFTARPLNLQGILSFKDAVLAQWNTLPIQ